MELTHPIEWLYERCEGIVYKDKKVKQMYHGEKTVRTYHLSGGVDDIVVPDDVYVEIKATATKGTIGRLTKLIVEPYGDDNKFYSFSNRFELEVEGRKQPVKIKLSHAKILAVHDGSTKYVRNVKSHDKVKVNAPVNKFKQELKKGDWVIGVTQVGKGLGIGRVTRWTNHNVWAVRGSDLTDKSKEFQFNCIADTFLIPYESVAAELTMAALKGWDGR